MPRQVFLFLAMLGIGTTASLTGGCTIPPPTKEEMAGFNYGPKPDNYEQIVRDYLKTRLSDAAGAVLEFRAGPNLLFQQATQLRPLAYGWGVCVLVNEKKKSGGFEDAYPMVFFIRDGKVVAVNGGNEDNLVGWRFARTDCEKLGFTVR